MKRFLILCLMGFSALFLLGCDFMSFLQSISQDTSALSSILTSISDDLSTSETSATDFETSTTESSTTESSTTESSTTETTASNSETTGTTTSISETTETTKTSDSLTQEYQEYLRQSLNAELEAFGGLVDVYDAFFVTFQLELSSYPDGSLLENFAVDLSMLVDSEEPYCEIRTKTDTESLIVIDTYGDLGHESLYLHQFVDDEWQSSEQIADFVDMEAFAMMTEMGGLSPEVPLIPQGSFIIPVGNGYQITFTGADILEDPDWTMFLQALAVIPPSTLEGITFTMNLEMLYGLEAVYMDILIEGIPVAEQPGATLDIKESFSITFPMDYLKQPIDPIHYSTGGDFAPTEIDPDSTTHTIDTLEWVLFSDAQTHYLKYEMPAGFFRLPENSVGLYAEDGTLLFPGRVVEITEPGIYYLRIDAMFFGSFEIEVATLWPEAVLDSVFLTHEAYAGELWSIQIHPDRAARVLKITAALEGMDFILIGDLGIPYEVGNGMNAWFHVPANAAGLLEVQVPMDGTILLEIEWTEVPAASENPEDWPELGCPENATYVILTPGMTMSSYRMVIETSGYYTMDFFGEPYLLRDQDEIHVSIRTLEEHLADFEQMNSIWLEAGTYYIDVTAENEFAFFVARPQIIKEP